MGRVVAEPLGPPPGVLHRGHRPPLPADRPQEDEGGLPAQGQQESGPAARLCTPSRPCLRLQ
jgi:hypothetical protein